MCGWVRGWVGVWFPHGNYMCGVRVLWVKDRVGGGDWLLRRCTCGGRCVGVLGCVRVHMFAEWSGCSTVLFSVDVEVREGLCVCDELLGVLLSCIVGWGMIVGLTGVMYVVLKARGVVTRGLA